MIGRYLYARGVSTEEMIRALIEFVWCLFRKVPSQHHVAAPSRGKYCGRAMLSQSRAVEPQVEMMKYIVFF